MTTKMAVEAVEGLEVSDRVLYMPPLSNCGIKLLNSCEPVSLSTKWREYHLVCEAVEGSRGILLQCLTESGIWQFSYLTADDLESMARLLRCGNNARGNSSKALDIAKESENLRIQR